ncbi:MAG: LysR family transcriptional regulator [Sandaracinaceae bacterium]
MSNVHDTAALHQLDLNLLVAFDTLARERSVTRAAERAGVTQSAMSHTLRRLRERFDDPLLVRGASGMTLTPRAEALVVPLRGALVGLARALEAPEAFDPAASTRELRVVAPDLFELLALPRLWARLSEAAPRARLAFQPPPRELSDALETGEVDVAIAPVLLGEEATDLGVRTGPQLRRQTLFRDGFRCFVRADHPALSGRKRMTAARFAALDHLLVSPTGRGPGFVDGLLAAQGLERRVALRVPQHTTALSMVRQSDLVLTAPASLEAACEDGRVRSVAPPFPLPEHAITLVWHPRFSDDPAHRWLREQVAAVARAIRSVSPRR